MGFVMVAGSAGVGKTTTARLLAERIRRPLLDLDTITNPLLNRLTLGGEEGSGHWNAAARRGTVRPARYAALYATIADQRHIGAVAVAPFTAELRGEEEWRQLVHACGEEPAVVWLYASEEVLVERRCGRAEPRDAHIVDTAAGVRPAVTHLALDAEMTPEHLVHRIMQHLGCTRELPAQSPVYDREFRGALFDLDGTLVDSLPAVLRSWRRIGDRFGVADPLAGGHGRPAATVVAESFPVEHATEALAMASELEGADFAGVMPIPGSVELLRSIPRDRVAIVTSGTPSVAEGRIAAAGVPRPDVVVTFDDVRRGKPDPEPFLLGGERLGLPVATCVAFEDAPAGVAAAHAAGCTVVAITGSHDAAELVDADLVVDRLDQLVVEPTAQGFRLGPKQGGSPTRFSAAEPQREV